MNNLNAEETSTQVETLFRLDRVAALSGLNESQIRNMVRRRVLNRRLNAKRELVFEFSDLVILREIRRLLGAGFSMTKILRKFRETRDQLPDGKSLSGVTLMPIGERLVVKEGLDLWDTKTGQFELNFEKPAAEDAIPLKTGDDYAEWNVSKRPDEYESDDWYNLGLDLEDKSRERAIKAYREAIRSNSRNVDAYVNLGRLHQLNRDIGKAKRCYEIALEVSEYHPIANYNMGTIFDELNEAESAIDFYMRAQDLADAHYNLSFIYLRNGNLGKSAEHFRKYEELSKDEP